MTGTAPRTRHGVWVAMLLAAIVVAAVLYRRQRDGDAEQFAPALPTLIVLPLHAAGARHEEGVLAEGLSEELRAYLAHIEGLRTIARASALRAGTEHLAPAQLARRVGATHVLQGELRELGGEQLHIELQLFDAPDGRLLWSQVYDHKLSDIDVLEGDVAHTVAAHLRLPLPGGAASPAVDTQVLRDYLEAVQLADGPQRTRSIDLLRGIVHKAPDYARARATLARLLSAASRGAPGGSGADLDEATIQAKRALELEPTLAEAHTASAVLACRRGDWKACFDSFQQALRLDPADAESRIAYAYWLSALGYVDQALAEAENAALLDPLSYNANFARARLLDTVGRHDEAARYLHELGAESGGLIYAQWHNAVWRHDYKAANALVASMPRSDGFRESYTVVSEALSEPRLWPQALPLIGTSERASGGINVQRIMMPNPDYGIVIAGLEKMLRDGWPSYYMLLWMPEYAAMRRDPAFQDFLKRTRLLDYWRERGFPALCRADGDGAACS